MCYLIFRNTRILADINLDYAFVRTKLNRQRKEDEENDILAKMEKNCRGRDTS